MHTILAKEQKKNVMETETMRKKHFLQNNRKTFEETRYKISEIEH